MITGFSSVEASGELVKGSSMEQWHLKSGRGRTGWRRGHGNQTALPCAALSRQTEKKGRRWRRWWGLEIFIWELVLIICKGEP